MKKSDKIVIIGVFAIASILLALPFTPLRHSFDGVSSKIQEQASSGLGIDFGKKFKSARFVAQSVEGDLLDFSNNLNSKKGKAIKSVNYQFQKSDVSLDNFFATTSNDKLKSGSAGGDMAVLKISKSARSNSAVAVSSIDVSTKNKSTTTTTTKQKANNDYNGTGGGTHPGYDPLGSLPVGDGNLFLLALSVVFAIIKFRKSFI